MKICSKCKTKRKTTDFNKNKSRADGLQTACKFCDRKRARRLYKTGKYTKKIREARKERTIQKQINICLYLQSHPCIDCGKANILELDFDHRDRNAKLFEISAEISNSTSWKRILEEINKCDVRCAGCHRIKTAKESDYYRYKFLNGQLE